MVSLFLLASLAGRNKKLILLSVGIAVLYAVTDEVHQLFVPGRSAAISDIVLDTIGIVFSSFVYTLIAHRNKKLYKL